MDTLWAILLQAVKHIQAGLFFLVTPLHVFGPTVTIALIAAATVLLARFFSRRFKTRRFRELEAEFDYWYNIKQEALRLGAQEPEKARQLGINIDKGKLNEVYYNYFFEGLLNNLLTLYIPIFSMLAFVNYTYRPKALEAMFGSRELFSFVWLNGKSYSAGPAFWFVACVLAVYILIFAFGLFWKRRGRSGDGKNEKTDSDGPQDTETTGGHLQRRAGCSELG
ncbi:MAG: hypothetical protein R6X08_06065 [Desulfosalsimonadaceae bacterium]